MTTIALNGIPTLSGKVFEPRVGTWWAEVQVSGDEVPSGQVRLDFLGELEFIGTVKSVRSAVDSELVTVRIEGGSGRLDELWLGPKHFRDVDLGTLIRDLTQRTGDTVDESVSGAVLGARVKFWTRPRTIGDAYLGSIAAEAGAAWRVLRNGNLWMGAETWPTESHDYIIEKMLPADNAVIVAPQLLPTVSPGITFEGKRVAEVLTSWDARNLRQTVAFEDANQPGRFTRSIQLDVADWFTRTNGTQLDLSALYPCRVAKQADDLNTLDLIPDDPKIAAQGLQGVPIRWGMPGVKAKVKHRSRVLLGFEAQDPKRPYAALWEYDNVEEVQIQPESNANVVVKASGSGKVSVLSDGVIEVNSPDVRLGDTAGSGVARIGDVVQITLPPIVVSPVMNPLSATPAGVVTGTIGLPMPIVATGQIISGKESVKA